MFLGDSESSGPVVDCMSPAKVMSRKLIEVNQNPRLYVRR